jgi:hypothetical protein
MTSRNSVGGDRSRAVNAAFALGLLLLTVACASPFDAPPPFDQGQLREHALTKTKDGIRVSAVIPSADEAKTIFGVDLRQEGIQPFWLEIENGTDRAIVFLPTGLDPEYFSPLEVAYLYNGPLTEEGHAALAEHIESLSFNSRKIMYPGDTTSGFVYLNLSDPTMVAEIDLIGREWSQRVSFLVSVPGMQKGRRVLTAITQLYTAADLVEINDETKLRRALEGLPCCATSENGTGQGLPLNLILIGDIEEWAPAFVRRMYRYSPASPWYAFGRVQDLAAHKFSRWVAPQPHTLRFWLTPLRYQGQPIWVAQVSTALGGRFAAPAESTQGIEPQVDEARNDIVQDLLYSQAMAKIGFVKGVGRVAPAEPRKASDGSTYHTDGLRAVMVFGGKPVSLDKVDFFDWERLVDHYRQQVD